MKLVNIFGNAAVGKMTVGQELAKITDLKLFHNHMTIEPVIEIFGYYDGDVIKKLRDVYFAEFAKSDNYGMIFTFMFALDDPTDWALCEKVESMFKDGNPNSQFYYVELVADREERARRNVTENRLLNKPSKRDIESSMARFYRDDERHRFESFEGEIPFENYMKIDNTCLAPEVVAKMIKERFDL
jgi:hypothetical protein